MRPVYENSYDGIYEPFHPLIAKWYKAKSDRLLPSASDFIAEADELPDYKMVSSIQLDPLDIQYSSVGAQLEKLYGGPMSGKNLEELYNDFFRKRAYEGYEKTLAEKLPVYEQRTVSTLFGKIGYYKIHLLFSDEDVTSAITYLVPTSPRFKRRWDWEKLIKKTPWF